MHPREKQKHGNYEPDAHGTPLLVSVPEAARLPGVGKTFGWEMVRSGDMPSIKLGRRVLVPRAALERLISIEKSVETLPETDKDLDAAHHLGRIPRPPDTRHHAP